MITRGRLLTSCHHVGWDMTCGAVTDDCFGLLYGQDRLGTCLQTVAACWGEAQLRSPPASADPTRVPPAFRVGDYLLDIDHLAFFKYFWARHGGVLHLTFPHDPYPVCWPSPAYRH